MNCDIADIALFKDPFHAAHAHDLPGGLFCIRTVLNGHIVGGIGQQQNGLEDAFGSGTGKGNLFNFNNLRNILLPHTAYGIRHFRSSLFYA